jgi:mono/diheme cytochrome c family protein
VSGDRLTEVNVGRLNPRSLKIMELADAKWETGVMVSACSLAGAILFWAALMLAPGTVLAQQPEFDAGKEEYALHCAMCHGIAGKGDGHYNQTRTRPTDLTGLAKANGGIFPFRRVREVIDGRREIEAHGTRDMPIWGTYFQAIDGAHGSSPNNTEPYARTRIKALVDYIYRLQAK